MKRILIFILIFAVLVCFTRSFALMQENEDRFGFGMKSGGVFSWIRENYYVLSYTRSDIQLDFAFGVHYLSKGPGLFGETIDYDDTLVPFSILANMLWFDREKVRGHIGVGIDGSYSYRNNSIGILPIPSARLGWEFGPYLGPSFMLEVGTPILLGFGAHFYI